jgi:hypothetical protein
MNGFSAVGGASVGSPMVLISKGRQHSIDDLTNMTVDQIIDVQNVAPERVIEAESLKFSVGSVLHKHFVSCITNEARGLVINENHCANDYEIRTYVDTAITEIQIMDHSWTDHIRSQEWRDAAAMVIGNMMATALHVERLWFIEDHPENPAAKQYRKKFEET